MKAISIKEAYIQHKRFLLPVESGILTIETRAGVDALRKAKKAEEKALNQERKDKISKTCKS